MIINSTVLFTAFYSNNCWILTRQKIASSWLIEQFNRIWITVEIDPISYDISFDKRRLTVTDEQYDELSHKFLSDWNELKRNPSAESHFIFLTKNPIHRFISGWVQDNIMAKIHFLDEEHERLLKYFDVELVDKFIEFVKQQINEPQNTFPDTPSLPVEFSNIYDEFCFPRNCDYFNTDINTYVYHISSDTHSKEVIYFLWQLLITKPFVANDNVHIIDIDLENIKQILPEKFNVDFKHENAYSNTRGDYLRNKAYAYLSEQVGILNPMLYADLFIWFELIRKIYFKDEFFGYCCEQRTYDMKTTKMVSDYKKKYNIPNDLDVFNIHTHINWYRYLPPITELEYI